MADGVRDVGGMTSDDRILRGSSSDYRGSASDYGAPDPFGREVNPAHAGGGGVPGRIQTSVSRGGGGGSVVSSYREGGSHYSHREDGSHYSHPSHPSHPSHGPSHHSHGTSHHDHHNHHHHRGAGSAMSNSQPPAVISPTDRNLPVLDGVGGDDGRSYGASSGGWGPGAADTYAGAGTYASTAYRSGGENNGRGGVVGGGGGRVSHSSLPPTPGGGGGAAAAAAAAAAAGGEYGLSGPGGTRGKSSRAFRDEDVRRLVDQGFSTGLARALAQNAMAFDHRIWVVDNSGSMQIGDGHRVVETGTSGGSGVGGGGVGGVGSKKRRKDATIRAVPSTRWEEIQDTVRYHAEMAALLDSPTVFKLLNDPGTGIGPQQFSVAHRGESFVSEDINVAIETMKRTKPGGVTPLTRHIWEIQQSIEEMSPQLQREGRKIVVVLATDGLPTDEQGYGGEYITNEFIRALRSLEGLPVWLVVRLCTDEEPVTRFYNNLDGQLELSLEVLDDFIGEAHEVYRHNKWLNYALPMHRCRELGYHDRLFDLVDERPLTKGEIRDFCALLFGVDGVDGIPDPGADWVGFMKAVQALLKGEQLQWNPIKKKMTPWINLKVLNKRYGGKSHQCAIM